MLWLLLVETMECKKYEYEDSDSDEVDIVSLIYKSVLIIGFDLTIVKSRQDELIFFISVFLTICG